MADSDMNLKMNAPLTEYYIGCLYITVKVLILRNV